MVIDTHGRIATLIDTHGRIASTLALCLWSKLTIQSLSWDQVNFIVPRYLHFKKSIFKPVIISNYKY